MPPTTMKTVVMASSQSPKFTVVLPQIGRGKHIVRSGGLVARWQWPDMLLGRPVAGAHRLKHVTKISSHNV